MSIKEFFRGMRSNTELIKTVSQSSYYMGSSVVGIIVSFISFPLYALLLTKEDFGILAFFSAVGTILTPFSVLSLTNYYIVRVGELSADEGKNLFRNLIWFNFLWTFVIVGVGGIVLYGYLAWTGSDISFFPNALFTFIILISQNLINFMAVRYRMSRSGMRFLVMQVAQIVGNAVLALSFIWLFNLGASGKLAGIALSNILVALLFGMGMGIQLRMPDMTKVREGLREMRDLTIASFLHSTVPSADVVVLETYNNLPGLGVYSVGKQIANFMSIAGSSLFQAFEPKLYEDLRRTSLLRSSYFGVFVGLNVLMLLMYFLFSDTIIAVLTAGKFYDSLQYSNILVFQAFSTSIIQALQIKLYIMKKVSLIAGVNLVGSTITLALIFPMTNNFLFTWAAVSFLVTSLFQLLLLIFALRRYGRN